MQTFEAALETELKTISALGNRVFPAHAPEANKNGGTPYLVYVSSEGLQDKTLDGYMDSKSVRAEVNIIADRYGTMKAITRDVVALLVGFEGRVIGTDGPFISELTYNAPVELYEEKPALHRCLVEFDVYFETGG